MIQQSTWPCSSTVKKQKNGPLACFPQTHNNKRQPKLSPKKVPKKGNTILPRSLTWNLKMSPWKRRFLLETIIFRFHVKFRGCTSITPGVEALWHLGWHHLRTLVAWQRLILHHIFRPQAQGDRQDGQHPPKHGSKFFTNNGEILETRSWKFRKNVGGLGCGSPGLTHVHPIGVPG